jgi:uncharacterized phage protein (TIGR01671 family)
MGLVVGIGWTIAGVIYSIHMVDPVSKDDYSCTEEFTTLMLSTGQKDKKGQEIYEGDIVKYMPFEDHPSKYVLAEVVREKGQFIVRQRTQARDYFVSRRALRETGVEVKFTDELNWYDIEVQKEGQWTIPWGDLEVVANAYQHPNYIENERIRGPKRSV